jgi:protein TonB
MRKAALALTTCCLITVSLPALSASLTSTKYSKTKARAAATQQQPNVEAAITVRPSTEPIPRNELKELRQKLSSAPETTIKVENDQLAPLVIGGVSLRSVHREKPADPASTDHSAIDYFAVRMSIRVKNSSPGEVNGFVLQLASDATKFELYRNKTTVAPGKHETVKVELMLVTADPTELVASLAGARFSSGVIWGKYPVDAPVRPMPQPPPPRSRNPAQPVPDHSSVPETPQTQPPASAAEASKQVLQLQIPASVDRRPIALNSPRASYTELARENGVTGTVTLRLLVGPDGEVKATRLVRGLPDFLTEQAISAAYQLKFNPAIKGGQPVPFWQVVTIDFNLR